MAQKGAVWLRVRVRCGSDRVRCGSDRVRCGSDRVRCGSERVRCGSDSSAPACCTAGPGSNLGSAPQRRPSTERKAMRKTRVVPKSSIYKVLYVCSINVKINKKSGSVPPNLFFYILYCREKKYIDRRVGDFLSMWKC